MLTADLFSLHYCHLLFHLLLILFQSNLRQTDRSRGDLAKPNVSGMSVCQNQSRGGTMPCFKRDYDLLGYRYALMSQVHKNPFGCEFLK